MSMNEKKIAWGITGAGAFLKECIEMILSFPKNKVDIFISKAGEEVLKMYRFWDCLKENNLILDRTSSSPSCGLFYRGVYSLLVIAPATSNTVAKMAYGIADTLITNIFAQSGKAGVPSVVLPTDVDEGLISLSPSGKEIVLKRRNVDEENILRLRCMENVIVVNSVRELGREINRLKL